MSKKSKKKKEKEKITKAFDITSAQIKDGLCNYSFKINIGVGVGDTHNVKGVGIVDDDMYDAYRKFNSHLACIDGIFKHSEVEVENIHQMHNHELTALYSVSGFKIKGTGENEQISLIGEKSIDAVSGRIALVTPFIPLDNLSSYTWFEELREVADDVRNEVELYKGGKCTVAEPAETIDGNQLTISDELNMQEAQL